MLKGMAYNMARKPKNFIYMIYDVKEPYCFGGYHTYHAFKIIPGEKWSTLMDSLSPDTMHHDTIKASSRIEAIAIAKNLWP